MSVEGEAEWDVCVCARGLVACEWWRVQVFKYGLQRLVAVGLLCRPLFELKGWAECLASALRAMAVALGRTASMRAARAMSPATPLKQLKYAMRGMAKSFEILWKWVVLAEFPTSRVHNTRTRHGHGTTHHLRQRTGSHILAVSAR